ncbi:MAG: hypothetical protein UT15_C0003G0011 [Berkelbacteria bacterium GW2011_GWA1_39_10]|uniref:Uncharacterized protein n=1 Tax=Berkelbacteria bacterium GW2011_GWA1_39_10 TaxID=1618332 RepID=A0A0G0PND8_9BACT|nr:MAG: hypothetical protein UT15_C0003G0011 [Berkelbacteria bacterium GW2011_GWA1_39_10]
MSEHIDTFVVLFAVAIVQTFSLFSYDDYAKSHERYYLWLMLIFTFSGILNVTYRNLPDLVFFIYAVFVFWFFALAVGWKASIINSHNYSSRQSIKVPDA